MAWYAYCLTEHQTLPNGTRSRRPFVIENVQGVNGAPVLSYPSGEFAVIVSEYDQNAGELGPESRNRARPRRKRLLPQFHRTSVPFRNHLRERRCAPPSRPGQPARVRPQRG